MKIYLSWTPSTLWVGVGSVDQDTPMVGAKGARAPTRFAVEPSGRIIELGNIDGNIVSSFHAYDKTGQPYIEPSALETWSGLADAIKIMSEAQSVGEPPAEVVQANAIVVMLVTGFETYAQKRFQELAGEGVRPNFCALSKAFRLNGHETPTTVSPLEYETEILPYTARTGINFQNYEQCKKAYREGYEIRFAGIAGVSSQDLRELKTAFSQRHKAIHVSPMESIRGGWKTGDLQFVTLSYAAETISLFDRFINALHMATLEVEAGVSSAGAG